MTGRDSAKQSRAWHRASFLYCEGRVARKPGHGLGRGHADSGGLSEERAGRYGKKRWQEEGCEEGPVAFAGVGARGEQHDFDEVVAEGHGGYAEDRDAAYEASVNMIADYLDCFTRSGSTRLRPPRWSCWPSGKIQCGDGVEPLVPMRHLRNVKCGIQEARRGHRGADYIAWHIVPDVRHVEQYEAKTPKSDRSPR